MTLVQAIMDLIFPPQCPFCRTLLPISSSSTKDSSPLPWDLCSVALEKLVCPRCLERLPWLDNCCPHCARPLTLAGDNCPYCLERPVAFTYCCALGSYQGALRETLHRFKYRGEKVLAVSLGRLMAARLAGIPWFSKVEMLVPVPLFPQRKRVRGYNQSALLAQTVSRELGIPSEELLFRVRDTDSQTGMGRQDRWENMRGAFEKSGRWQSRLEGKEFLLIDDILTSGATAHAAALVLKEAGASCVNVAVIAR